MSDALTRRPRIRRAGPTRMSAREWKNVMARVKTQVKADNVSLLAGGVAFYALLAIVPAMVAAVSIYGLVADPDDITRNVDSALAAAPDEVRNLATSQLNSIVEASPSGLQVGAVVGVAIALWSASSGVKHLIQAVNAAYDLAETRGFLQLRGLAVLFTLGAIVLLAVVVGLLSVLPSTLADEGAGGVARTVFMIVRWPVRAIIAALALGALYRYSPNRATPRCGWASPGAIFAMVGWVIASIGFSIYTSNFGSYNETYGALGTVVVLMLWLMITAFVVIVGAEINSEYERQAAHGGTAGKPELQSG